MRMNSTAEPVPPDQAGQLIDQPLAEEIELLGDLLAATADVERALTEPEIDAALGVSPDGDDPPPPQTSRRNHPRGRHTS